MRPSLLALVVVILSGCSGAKAGGSSARVIPTPLSGYTCFAVEDGAGNAVGGNCVKD